MTLLFVTTGQIAGSMAVFMRVLQAGAIGMAIILLLGAILAGFNVLEFMAVGVLAIAVFLAVLAVDVTIVKWLNETAER